MVEDTVCETVEEADEVCDEVREEECTTVEEEDCADVDDQECSIVATPVVEEVCQDKLEEVCQDVEVEEAVKPAVTQPQNCQVRFAFKCSNGTRVANR